MTSSRVRPGGHGATGELPRRSADHLDHLARSLDLVGGDIRNAATEAAYRAAAREGSITRRLLADAISDELLKKGKSPPLDLGGPDADSR